jgi:hypothetical protein
MGAGKAKIAVERAQRFHYSNWKTMAHLGISGSGKMNEKAMKIKSVKA